MNKPLNHRAQQCATLPLILFALSACSTLKAVEPAGPPDDATGPSKVAATASPLPVTLHEPALPELPGRVVWLDSQAGTDTAYQLDLSSGQTERLWTESGGRYRWQLSPDGSRAAYLTRDQRIVTRALSVGAEAISVAPPLPPDTERTSPIWTAGNQLAYGEHGAPIYFTDAPDLPCSYVAVAEDEEGRVLWSGRLAEIPGSAGCPHFFQWSPDSGRLALRPMAFEASGSERIDLLEAGETGIAARVDLIVASYANAPSPDGRWLAVADSALYYAAPYADVNIVYPQPGRWPGKAWLKLVDSVDGSVTDLWSHETAIGMTHPLWSPDGSWLAVAEPLGSFPTPAPAAYPAPHARDPQFRPAGTALHIVSRGGERVAEIVLDVPNALPVAASPDGRYLLLAVIGSSTALHVYRVSDGAGGVVAELPAGWPAIGWAP